MQFFAYYGMNAGGLYFAAADGEGCPKWLNFFKNVSGSCEASFIHGCEDMGPGKGIAPPYAVQVALLEGSDWHEAADRYKAWAHAQRWCAGGKLADRPEEENGDGWLHREMGVSTFGINAGSDRTAWLRVITTISRRRCSTSSGRIGRMRADVLQRRARRVRRLVPDPVQRSQSRLHEGIRGQVRAVRIRLPIHFERRGRELGRAAACRSMNASLRFRSVRPRITPFSSAISSRTNSFSSTIMRRASLCPRLYFKPEILSPK